MKKSLFLFLLSPIFLHGQQSDVILKKDISTIAFGSCSKQDQPEDQLWNEINSANPDLWIWLGDNIYGDTENMEVMKEKYDLQKSHPGYQKLLKQTDAIGIWDDHDFGENDGGKEYPAKDGSKKELLDFLDVSEDHPVRSRLGVYQSYTYSSQGGTIKVILLDTRYFRDSLKWNNPGTSEKSSIINPSGDILGETQWAWFERQLSDPTIDFFVIGSGIQVIPNQHRWEKWSNFPKSRGRLFKTVTKANAPLVFLSGDRHLSEVSKIEIPEYKYPIYEFTSSSLTSPSGIEKEENQYMVKDKIYETNFAVLSIQWESKSPVLNLNYYGKKGKKLADYSIQYK